MEAANDSCLREKLLLEYSQFREVQKLLNWLQEQTAGFQLAEHRNQRYKVESNFGRWLMMMQFSNFSLMSERFPLLPRELTDRAEFVRSIRSSFSNMSSDEATGLVDALLTMIDQFLQREGGDSIEPPEIRYEERDGQGRIEVGEFSTPSCKRVKDLVELCGEQQTALMCLRYHSLGLFKGGEISICSASYNALFELGEARFEGFASPLNSQLLNRPGVKFCSLFQDTDSAVGSLGDFFRIDMMEHRGGWVLHPPFVELLLEATARRVVDLLDDAERGDFWFFILLPYWIDCDGWKILDKSQWKLDRIDVQANLLGFQDCYGKPIGQQISVSLFAVGDPPDSVNFGTLWDAMRRSPGERY